MTRSVSVHSAPSSRPASNQPGRSAPTGRTSAAPRKAPRGKKSPLALAPLAESEVSGAPPTEIVAAPPGSVPSDPAAPNSVPSDPVSSDLAAAPDSVALDSVALDSVAPDSVALDSVALDLAAARESAPPPHPPSPPFEAQLRDPLTGERESAPPPHAPSPVNYDDEGLLEVTLDEDIYRFDAGKQGTAVCLSRRAIGVWSWSFLGELRWDGKDLRSRSLDRKLLAQLAEHLRAAARESSY